jgi:hypothetical protein
MGIKNFHFSLVDAFTGEAIKTAGGNLIVLQNGTSTKQAIKDSAGAAASNPLAINYGVVDFYTADTVATVDVVGFAPGGQFIAVAGIAASGPNEIKVDTSRRKQTARIPFSITDMVAATEYDTGLDLPTNALVIPTAGLSVDVKTIDATETIDVGILSSESGGDADGIAALVALDTAVVVPAAVTVTAGVFSANTFGALVSSYTAGTNADDRGLFMPKMYRCDGTAKSISLTLTTGSDTAKGFVNIPYVLAA